MTFPEYVELMRLQAAPAREGAGPTGNGSTYGALLNQRMMRNLQTYVVSDDLRRTMQALRKPQSWMVITEPSCGDSSQLVPIIWRIAECSQLIKLDLVLRDEHPEIMDAYLTGGKRSIPKLVAFDQNGKELFRWGARPGHAQKLFEQTLKDGQPKQVALERVHLFYARDKGKAVDQEFLEIFTGMGLD